MVGEPRDPSQNGEGAVQGEPVVPTPERSDVLAEATETTPDHPEAATPEAESSFDYEVRKKEIRDRFHDRMRKWGEVRAEALGLYSDKDLVYVLSDATGRRNKKETLSSTQELALALESKKKEIDTEANDALAELERLRHEQTMEKIKEV